MSELIPFHTVSGEFTPSPGTVIASYTFAGKANVGELLESSVFTPNSFSLLIVRVSLGGAIIIQNRGSVLFYPSQTTEYTVDLIYSP